MRATMAHVAALEAADTSRKPVEVFVAPRAGMTSTELNAWALATHGPEQPGRLRVLIRRLYAIAEAA